MATLWLREFNNQGNTRPGDRVGVAREPGLADQTVTFTTSTQSAPFGPSTTFIAMLADAAFHYVVGPNPTATTAALKVPANTLYHIGVTPGDRIAVIAGA